MEEVEEEERRKKKGGRREKVEVVRVEEGGEEGMEMEGAGQEGRRKGMSRKRRRGDGRKGEKGNKKRTKGRKGAVGRRRSRKMRKKRRSSQCKMRGEGREEEKEDDV